MAGWNQDRESQLKVWCDMGLTCDQISDKFALMDIEYSRNAIIGKVDRLRRKGVNIKLRGRQDALKRVERRKKRAATQPQARMPGRKGTKRKEQPKTEQKAPWSRSWWGDHVPHAKKGSAVSHVYRELDMNGHEDKLRSVDELYPNQCRWPLAEDPQGRHLFCPRQKAPGRASYCEFHSVASSREGVRHVETFRAVGRLAVPPPKKVKELS